MASERPLRLLDSGRAGPEGLRGVVVRYPRSHDYFRRMLARVSGELGPAPADDPAAKLLDMTRRLLAPTPEREDQPGLGRPRSRA